MNDSIPGTNWKPPLAMLVLVGGGATIAACVTGLWVLTACPVGLLFGFFLQKGDLCGASAFSEVLLLRDRRKLIGLWIVIVTAMAGIAVLDLLGWVKMNPKPFTYLNHLVGGIVFGVGMVLAGGCVSGCLYKAGGGNLNSILALLAMPVGILLVEHGPLKTVHAAMKTHVVKTGDGKVLSLPNVLGLDYGILALIFVGITALAWFLFARHGASRAPGVAPGRAGFAGAMTRSWKPWVAGLAIGLLMVPAYLSSAASGRNYPLGVTHGVMHAELLLIETNINHVYAPKPKAAPPKAESPAGKTAAETKDGVEKDAPAKPPEAKAPAKAAAAPKPKKVSWWLVILVTSLVLGSHLGARMSGKARLLPKPPDELLVAILGGFLVGAGAALATGCVVGNIMSGWALMSLGNVLFAVVVILANWVTTWLYLMGRASRTGA